MEAMAEVENCQCAKTQGASGFTESAIFHFIIGNAEVKGFENQS